MYYTRYIVNDMIDVKSQPIILFSFQKTIILPRLFRIITHWKMGLKAKTKARPLSIIIDTRHTASKVHYSNKCVFRFRFFFKPKQKKKSGDGVLYCRMHLFYGLTMPCFKMSRYVTLSLFSLHLLQYLLNGRHFFAQKIYH